MFFVVFSRTPGERCSLRVRAGVKTLTFEPNNQPLWDVTRRRILAALTAPLRGEIHPRARRLVEGTGERIQVVVSYQLASIGVTQRQTFLRRGHRSWLTHQPPRSYSPAARPIRAAGVRTACRARCPRSATTSTGSLGPRTVFRLFMMEELAARVPERQRWTPADLETVLVEALAAVLDQLSDRADGSPPKPPSDRRGGRVGARLLQYIATTRCAPRWRRRHPARSHPRFGGGARVPRGWRTRHDGGARAAGVRRDPRPNRMVTAEAHAASSELHPRCCTPAPSPSGAAHGRWSGRRAAVVDRPIDEKWSANDRASLQAAATPSTSCATFRRSCGTQTTTTRSVLTPYVEAPAHGRPAGADRGRGAGRHHDGALDPCPRQPISIGGARCDRARARTGQADSSRRKRIEFGACSTCPRGPDPDGVAAFEVASVNRLKRVGPRWPDRSWRPHCPARHRVRELRQRPRAARARYYSLVLHGGRTG